MAGCGLGFWVWYGLRGSSLGCYGRAMPSVLPPPHSLTAWQRAVHVKLEDLLNA